MDIFISIFLSLSISIARQITLFIVYFPIRLEKKVNDALNYRELSSERSFFFIRANERQTDILDSPVNWGHQSILAKFVGIGDSTRCNKIIQIRRACADIWRKSCSQLNIYENRFEECAMLISSLGRICARKIGLAKFMNLLSQKFLRNEVPHKVSLLSFQIGSWPLINFFFAYFSW